MENNTPAEFTILGGSFLEEGNLSYVNISKKVDAFTLKNEGNMTKFWVNGQSSADIRLKIKPTTVRRDGAVYADWLMEDTSTLKISTGLSEHMFELSSMNGQPVMGAIPPSVIDEGKLLTLKVNATDPDGDVLSYSVLNLPAGAVFNATTRLFSWTPGYDQAGNYTITFRVSDGALSDTGDAVITVRNVNRAPVMDAIPPSVTDDGKLFTLTVTASDPDGDILKYSASGLPAGAAFNATTRLFSWTPGYDQIGNYTITFRVSDGALSDTVDAIITVMEVNRAPVMDAIPSYVTDEGKLLTFRIIASDPDGDVLSFSVMNLPKGASYKAADGTFSWTPQYDQAGIYRVTFSVSDGELSVSRKAKITVLDFSPNGPPKTNTPTNQQYYIKLE
jgi:PKD repeat protein